MTKSGARPDFNSSLLTEWKQTTATDPEAFNVVLEEAEDLLAQLTAEATRGKILDPDIPRRQELLVRLNPLVAQVKQKWRELQELDVVKESEDAQAVAANQFARKKLQAVMSRLVMIIRTTQSLTVAATGNFNQDIRKLNEEISEYQKQEKILQQYNLLEKDTQSLVRLEYIKRSSIYAGYLVAVTKGIVTAWLAWVDTLNEATKTAGAIFYPISASFITLTKLFVLTNSLLQLAIATHATKNPELTELHRQELNNAKAALGRGIVFKAISFTLNFLSILTFLGIMATPLGVVFVAAATFMDWVDNGLLVYRNANKELQAFKNDPINKKVLEDIQISSSDPRQRILDISAAIKEAEEARHKLKMDKVPNKEEIEKQTERIKILEELRAKQKRVDRTKSTAISGAINVLALVLIASSPIPVAGPIMGVVGLAILGAVTLRNTWVTAKPHVKKWLSAKAHQKPRLDESAGPGLYTKPPMPKQEIELSITEKQTLEDKEREADSKTVAKKNHQEKLKPNKQMRAPSVEDSVEPSKLHSVPTKEQKKSVQQEVPLYIHSKSQRFFPTSPSPAANNTNEANRELTKLRRGGR